jgi:hypothetical protein
VDGSALCELVVVWAETAGPVAAIAAEEQAKAAGSLWIALVYGARPTGAKVLTS